MKISDQMHADLRVAGLALSRSINAQAEHWMRVGMLCELHPDLDHRDICKLLIEAEGTGGLRLTSPTREPRKQTAARSAARSAVKAQA